MKFEGRKHKEQNGTDWKQSDLQEFSVSNGLKALRKCSNTLMLVGPNTSPRMDTKHDVLTARF